MGLWNLITDSNGFLTSGYFFNDQTPDTKHLILKKKILEVILWQSPIK